VGDRVTGGPSPYLFFITRNRKKKEKEGKDNGALPRQKGGGLPSSAQRRERNALRGKEPCRRLLAPKKGRKGKKKKMSRHAEKETREEARRGRESQMRDIGFFLWQGMGMRGKRGGSETIPSDK